MAALRAGFSTLLTVGMVVLGTAAPASAEISRVGVVTTLDGSATLSRVALPQGVPLKVRDDVFVADRIVTGDKSFARILFGGKAIVTVRERSVLTITEAPGTSTIDVSIGRVAVAVVKERMKPGESVEIRTPNAVAGIRGTVVVAEVAQATSQLGATSGGFTTTITVLKGRIEFRQLDRLTRQPSGPGVAMGALQSIRVTGFAAPRPVQKVPSDVQQQLINDFRVPLRSAAATTNSAMAEGQIRQAISAVGAQLGALNAATSDTPAPAKSEDNQGSSGKTSEDSQGSSGNTSESGQGRNAKTSDDNQGRNAKTSEDSQGSNGNTSESSQGRNAKTSGDNQGRNAKASEDSQGSSGNTSESSQGRNAKASGDNQGRNAKTSEDNQGSSGNTSGSNKAGKGNSNASGNSSPSGNPGSTGSGGTASVTGGSGVSGGAPAGTAPAATSSVTTAAPAVSVPTSSAPAAAAPPAAPPATSGGTTSVRSVPAAPTAQNVPVNVTSGNQGNLGTSTHSVIQKAIDKASKLKSRSRR